MDFQRYYVICVVGRLSRWTNAECAVHLFMNLGHLAEDNRNIFNLLHITRILFDSIVSAVSSIAKHL